MPMNAKSLDIVVLLRLVADSQPKTYAELSHELGMSASEIHAAVKRCVAAGLLEEESRKPLFKAVEEYLLHGVRYAFPAKRGPLARGVPTAYAAPPLASQIHSEDLPPVWPDPEGQVKGFAVEPLYPSVPRAARSNPKLYELLALVDAVRIGRVRERQLAGEELKKRLAHANAD
jgi:DNA-binding Lrp family transcriptional regulator